MNFKSISAVALSVALAAPAMMANDEPTYLRSSIYTVLVKSNEQNQRIDKETKEGANANEFMSLAKSFANTDAKKAANDTVYGNYSLSELPQLKFLELPIPNQFNDHNLADRIIDFDLYRPTITDAEKNAANPKSNGQKLGGFMKSFGGAMLASSAGKTESSMVRVDDVDDYMPAVIQKFFAEKNTAAGLVGKWFDYDGGRDQKWNDNIVVDRGLYAATEAEKARAKNDDFARAYLNGKGYELINNTFVVALNFRFRSNQAIVAESQALASGILGSGYGSLLGAAASAAAGDGFSVQAVSHLYKLEWNDEISTDFAENIFFKNASIDELIAKGICKLTFVGKEKASASVRQSLFSDKPMSELVLRATGRAVDAAIAKLQVKNDVFRTIVPISGVDDQGNVFAKIGMKEGVAKDDTYEILEPREDANGRTEFKVVGTVKAVDKQIWNNLFGAEDELAENTANAKGKSKDFDDAAVNLGKTTFKGAKKGQDYTGYLLRLKKKK